MAQMTEGQLAAVREMGLGSLIDLKCGRLKRTLCKFLVEKVDTCRSILKINGSEVELSHNNFSHNNFSHIMGLSDGGLPLQLNGDSNQIDSYLSLLKASSRGIKIKDAADLLQSLDTAEDVFKVTFMVFALGTVLCPSGSVHISHCYSEPSFPICSSDTDENTIPDTEDDHHVLEGYSSENDMSNLYEIGQDDETLPVQGFVFYGRYGNHMKLFVSQIFENNIQLKRALEVYAMREGFRLCVMENRQNCVSCECASHFCDWSIGATLVGSGDYFHIIYMCDTHACRRNNGFRLRSRWISSMFLHKWQKDPSIHATDIVNAIEEIYSVRCPITKVIKAELRSKALLRLDQAEGYSNLYTFVDRLKKTDSDNVVVLEREGNDPTFQSRFKRMFISFDRPCFTFKYHCPQFIAIDGWQLPGPFPSVMLVAACVDGNDGILPIAFSEVLHEDVDSWVFFFTNLKKVLNTENGLGLCILTDGDNGLDYVVEEYLCQAESRLCCRDVYSKFVTNFPNTPVHHLFWAACRSTNSYRFYKYMKLIREESDEAHMWLMMSDWKKWALHRLPGWVKCNHVTLFLLHRLKQFLKIHLNKNITDRYVGITDAVSSLFEHRRNVTLMSIRNSFCPVVRHIIDNNLRELPMLHILEENISRFAVVDTVRNVFEFDLKNRLCSCGLWEKCGVPCPHACKCILAKSETFVTFIHNIRSVNNYYRAYSPGMRNIVQADFGMLGHEDNIILPPEKIPTASRTSVKTRNSSSTSQTNTPPPLLHPFQNKSTPPPIDAFDVCHIPSTSSDEQLQFLMMAGWEATLKQHLCQLTNYYSSVLSIFVLYKSGKILDSCLNKLTYHIMSL